VQCALRCCLISSANPLTAAGCAAGAQPHPWGAQRSARLVSAVAAPEAPSTTEFQQQYRLPNNTSVKVCRPWQLPAVLSVRRACHLAAPSGHLGKGI
jgi:hypothetical protein